MLEPETLLKTANLQLAQRLQLAATYATAEVAHPCMGSVRMAINYPPAAAGRVTHFMLHLAHQRPAVLQLSLPHVLQGHRARYMRLKQLQVCLLSSTQCMPT